MPFLRALVSGLIVWTLIFLSFTIMSFTPGVQDSKDTQNIIILLLVIPFVWLSLKFFYKNKFVVGCPHYCAFCNYSWRRKLFEFLYRPWPSGHGISHLSRFLPLLEIKD